MHATYLRSALSDTHTRFSSLDLETQYGILICASQYQHPPNFFYRDFAAQGGDVVPFLTEKLRASDHGPTIRDIIDVFREMQIQGTYDIANDPTLMHLLDSKVRAMRPSAARDHAMRVIQSIKA